MNINDLKTQYEFQGPKYRLLCKEIINQLEVLLKEANVKLAVPITYRVKEWTSIIDKCNRYSLKILNISEINDLAGIRIITLFEKDIKKVQEIIKKYFSITREEDTSTRLSENQFGYGSIHYEMFIPDDWKNVPTLKELEGLRVELQLRTISQHTWAAASHVLNYKKEADVPKALIRAINRVAALLEVVDLEFGRVLEEKSNFNDQPIEEDDILNSDNLESILEVHFPKLNKMPSEDYSDLITELQYLNIIKVNQLVTLINKHIDTALESDKAMVNKVIHDYDQYGYSRDVDEIERAFRGVYFNHTGLLREVLESEYGSDAVFKAMNLTTYY